jgi:hypothetical protein
MFQGAYPPEGAQDLIAARWSSQPAAHAAAAVQPNADTADAAASVQPNANTAKPKRSKEEIIRRAQASFNQSCAFMYISVELLLRLVSARPVLGKDHNTDSHLYQLKPPVHATTTDQ